MTEPLRPIEPYGWRKRVGDALTLAALVLFVMIVDTLLPPERIHTEVHPMTYRHTDTVVDYIRPLSGGDVGHCALDTECFLTLAPGDAIVVERSALFDRCLGIQRIPPDG